MKTRSRRVIIGVGVVLLVASVTLGTVAQPTEEGGMEDDRGDEELERQVDEGDEGEPHEETNVSSESGFEGGQAGEGHEGGEGEDGLVGTIGALSMEHSYTAFFLAALTGVLSRRGTPRFIRNRLQGVHRWLAYAAGVLVLLHILTQIEGVALTLGVAQMALTGSLENASPREIGGALRIGIGFGATVVTAVAAVSFLRPRLFDSTVPPTAVHAFAYTGFAFATVHSLTFGHDVGKYVVFASVVVGLLVLQTAWSYRGRYLEIRGRSIR
ncbi:MAG: hypothetical protein SV253_09965 [Halobacteria archaeon]|nr:hypothetical protein [Halobacteria archaeon]